MVKLYKSNAQTDWHFPQFGHCPKAREGPALGCNFCWNTTDSNGRILRRKTKYHCPVSTGCFLSLSSPH